MEINVAELVTEAMAQAKSQVDIEGASGAVHRERSRRFVEALGAGLRMRLARPEVRVLTKHYDVHRQELGLNELLFDVLACEIDKVSSARAGVKVSFITKGLWAIESEFARDPREALYDFNKLVLADCESKLFVGSHTADDPGYLRVLASAAAHCRGEVYVALLPHPDGWREPGSKAVTSYRWVAGDWAQQ